MSLTALENRRSIGGPAADLTAHNPASISDSDPIENGTYALGYVRKNVRRGGGLGTTGRECRIPASVVSGR
jgi:hypothetical protein